MCLIAFSRFKKLELVAKNESFKVSFCDLKCVKKNNEEQTAYVAPDLLTCFLRARDKMQREGTSDIIKCYFLPIPSSEDGINISNFPPNMQDVRAYGLVYLSGMPVVALSFLKGVLAA